MRPLPIALTSALLLACCPAAFAQTAGKLHPSQVTALSLPAAGQATTTTDLPALSIAQTGSGGGNGILATTAGEARAGIFASGSGVDGYGVYAVARDTLGKGVGSAVSGYHTGIGDGGDFYIDSSKLTGYQSAVRGINAGAAGSAGVFKITNPKNVHFALYATTPGVGAAIVGTVSKPGAYAVWGYATEGTSGLFSGGGAGGNFCEFQGAPSGWFCTTADARLRERSSLVEPNSLLKQLAALPIAYYQTRDEEGAPRYLGPTAEDFHAAFQLGDHPNAIATGDEAGVALAAIQGLYKLLQEKDREIAALKDQAARTEAHLATIEKRIEEIADAQPVARANGERARQTAAR